MPEVGFELGPGGGTKIMKRLLYLCAISPHPLLIIIIIIMYNKNSDNIKKLKRGPAF